MSTGRATSRTLPLRIQVRIAAWLFSLLLATVLALTYGARNEFSLPVMGEATGVLAVIFLALSLVFMLRVPGLANRVGGLESMYGLHRGFGLAGYGFALLHPLLLAWQEGTSLLSLHGKNFGFRSGWTALLILMVVLLCTFLLKTRGYAIWRRLHMLSVTALLLMVWHVVSSQTDWPWAGKAAMDTLLLITIAVPILRHFLVDQGRLATSYVVEEVGYPATGVVDMHLRPSGQGFAIQPGQFVFARFLPGAGWTGCDHFHPFTASAVDPGGMLRLSIKASGPCTRTIQTIQPGAAALLQGPFGDLFQNVRQNSEVWIAGGIGITPFLARARALDARHVPVRLFYFSDQAADAPYREELEALAATNPALTLHLVSTRDARAAALTILDAILPPWNDKHYVLCGSESFTGFMRNYLTEHRVRPASIAEERFEFR